MDFRLFASWMLLLWAVQALVITVFACRYHYRNGSPAWHIVHDCLMAWVWPAILVLRRP